MPQIIIVAVDSDLNTLQNRVTEYAPTNATVEVGGKMVTMGGGAKDYINSMVKDVKSVVDGKYRTKSDRHHTAIGGSSMGGLAAYHAAVNIRPDVFGRALVMSPSLFWDGQSAVKEVESRKTTRLPDFKLYLDSGGVGATKDGKDGVDRLKRAIESQKNRAGGPRFEHGRNFQHFYAATHPHSEGAWRERFPKAVEFLFNDVAQ